MAKKSAPPVDRKSTAIDGKRWNELHQYSFSINVAGKDGKTPPKANKDFPLQLAPQSISISTPFAISAVATNAGILEENNGVVFRTISISGTTGLYPLREVAKPVAQGSSGSFKSSLTSGTASAVKTATAATPSNQKNAKIQLEDTGYYQFWALNNFLVDYAEQKKKKDGTLKRLVFNCPKDNISYVCTPVAFNMSRNAGNPLLYNYSITLRSWDVTTDTGTADPAFKGMPNKANKGETKKALKRMTEARNVITKNKDKVKASTSSIADLLSKYSNGVMKIKDWVQEARRISDMPEVFKNNVFNTFKYNKVPWNEITNDLINKRKINSIMNPFVDTRGHGDSGGGKGTKLGNAVAGGILPQGIQVLNGQGSRTNPDGSTPAAINETVNPAAIQIINQIADTPELSDEISIDQLGKYSPSMQKQIDDKIYQMDNITPGEIRDIATQFKVVSDNYAYSAGMMDATYAKTYGLRIPLESEMREPTEQDILLAVSIEEARDALLTTLASGDLYVNEERNPMNSANDALEDDDKISTPSSAFPVPVNRGATLEDIAIQYLGDATRSREIVLLNDLKSPFIDEIGFDLNIYNCSGRSFIVKDTSKLAIRQSIRITGVLMPVSRRRIMNIEPLGGNEFKITVDGQPDLNQYDSGKYPKLLARLPGTVGTGDVLIMPSDEPADDQSLLRSTGLTERLSYAEKIFKVDCALHPITSDLVVSSSGDIARSYGYQNAIQAIKMTIETERKELFLHPDYGISAQIGRVINTELYKEITERIRSAIIKDPRFNNATVSIKKDGTAVRISVEVIGSNGTGRIPLEFELSE